MSLVAKSASPSASMQAVSAEASASPESFSADLPVLFSPLSASAESIRAVRTHILAQHVQAGRRALAVCAPGVGVGCTFLAANLAVAAAQAGLQVLLVDANMRTPAIDSIIRPKGPAEGLAECLASTEFPPAAYIQSNVLPGLSVLYAGHASVNAQELLARERFVEVVNACLRDYDLTILDTPPANTYADALRISTVAGYAMIVARRNKTLVPDVKTLAHQLQSDNAVVIGTVMNA